MIGMNAALSPGIKPPFLIPFLAGTGRAQKVKLGIAVPSVICGAFDIIRGVIARTLTFAVEGLGDLSRLGPGEKSIQNPNQMRVSIDTISGFFGTVRAKAMALPPRQYNSSN